LIRTYRNTFPFALDGDEQTQTVRASRYICLAINELINAGYPVVTAGKGYFVATSGDDLAESASYLEKQAFGILTRARRLRRMAVGEYFEFLGRQASLFEGES